MTQIQSHLISQSWALRAKENRLSFIRDMLIDV